jgi:hypothetical protein
MRRAAVISLALVLLWAFVARVNDAVAGLHVGFFVGGLFVTYAALMLPLGDGLAAVLIGGAVCDAHAPVAFGTHALLFAVAHVLIFHFRDRLPRDETAGRILVALTANLGLFLAISVKTVGAAPASAAVWLRLIADLVCSQAFLALIAPWFFALQERALALTRIEAAWR